MIESLTKDDQASFLAIKFVWTSKRSSRELVDPDIGWQTQFACIMNCIADMKEREILAKEIPGVLKWASLIVRESENEWNSLTSKRKNKPLSEWYRQHYLKSNLWDKLRSIVLENDEHRCLVCDREANFVHHASYDDVVMRGLDLRCLWSLCRRCHQDVEFDGERKRSVFEAANRLEFLYDQKFRHGDFHSPGTGFSDGGNDSSEAT